MVGTYITTKYVFDIHDEGYLLVHGGRGMDHGHSYVIYGPLANGATTLMYEGAPNFPDFGRFWAIIDRQRVTIFYTAPTAIRAFHAAGRQFADRHDLSSLSIAGDSGRADQS